MILKNKKFKINRIVIYMYNNKENYLSKTDLKTQDKGKPLGGKIIKYNKKDGKVMKNFHNKILIKKISLIL